MKIKVNDLVTRKSYNNDLVFKVINIKNDMYILKGVEVRLYADAPVNDLVLVGDYEREDFNVVIPTKFGDRDDFFYLPAKILHIDGDSEYLQKCLSFYKKNNVFAVGKKINESNIASEIILLLKEYKPDIIIITGHDAQIKNSGIKYKNSTNFINAVREARKYEKSHEKLVIIAGACQSNYEELIKAGANFASSPKRVNIHALDPAIIAVTLALTEKNVEIDLLNMLKKTKYGSDGIGGIKSMGLMYVGYPR